MIPTDWELLKLQDTSLTIIDGDRGNNYPKSDDFTDDGYCLFLSAKNITKNGFRLNEKQFISEEKDNLLRKGKLKDLDIIITTRGSVGHIAYNENIQYKDMRINSGMVILRNNDENINQKYMYKLFASNVIQRQIEKIAFGSAQPQLTVKEINNLKIPLPPLKEQEKIADILSTADDKIDAIATQIEKAQTLKKGLLQKLLSEGIGHNEFKDSELGKIPESWEIIKIGKICNLTAGGTPSTSEKLYWYPKEVSWLSSGEVNKKKVFFTDNKISTQGLDNSSAKLLPYNSILIALAGQGKTRGTVAITEIELTTNQSVAAILPSDKLAPYYLYYNLASRYDELRSLSTGSGGRGGLNLAILKSVNIQFPPLEEQKQIADILSTADEKLEVLRAKKKKYETLKIGLLQKLLSGEVRVL